MGVAGVAMYDPMGNGVADVALVVSPSRALGPLKVQLLRSKVAPSAPVPFTR